MVLHSNMIGNIMFGGLVKPNQSKSNQIKPVENMSSRDAGVEASLMATMQKGLKMGHFEATLLEH